MLEGSQFVASVYCDNFLHEFNNHFSNYIKDDNLVYHNIIPTSFVNFIYWLTKRRDIKSVLVDYNGVTINLKILKDFLYLDGSVVKGPNFLNKSDKLHSPIRGLSVKDRLDHISNAIKEFNVIINYINMVICCKFRIDQHITLSLNDKLVQTNVTNQIGNIVYNTDGNLIQESTIVIELDGDNSSNIIESHIKNFYYTSSKFTIFVIYQYSQIGYCTNFRDDTERNVIHNIYKYVILPSIHFNNIIGRNVLELLVNSQQSID